MMCPSGGEAPLTGTVNSMEGEPYRSFKGRMFFGEGSSVHWNKQYRGTNSAAVNLLIKNRTGGDGTNSRDTHCTNIIQTSFMNNNPSGGEALLGC